MLNALREVHLILSEGAHNQYGDLPWVARQEMLMQQWILARPEFREFLPTRIMVAYPESWMDRVDAMKRLQNWTDTSVRHFRDLGIMGEKILLSIRFGNWSDITNQNFGRELGDLLARRDPVVYQQLRIGHRGGRFVGADRHPDGRAGSG